MILALGAASCASERAELEAASTNREIGVDCRVPLELVEIVLPDEPVLVADAPFEIVVRYDVGPVALPTPCLGGPPPGSPHGTATASLNTLLQISGAPDVLMDDLMLSEAQLASGTTFEASYEWDGLDSSGAAATSVVPMLACGFVNSDRVGGTPNRPFSEIVEQAAAITIHDVAPPPLTADAIAAFAELETFKASVAGTPELSGAQRQQIHDLLMRAQPEVFAALQSQQAADRVLVEALTTIDGISVSAGQLAAWQDLFDDSQGAVRVSWNPDRGSPATVTFGKTRQLQEATFEDDASALIDELSSLLDTGASEEFVLRDVNTSDGHVDVTFDRVVAGFSVDSDHVAVTYERDESVW